MGITHNHPLLAVQRGLLAALIALLAGCQTIGAGVVARDRLDYASAIGDSWKQQTLLNIVRMRYFDTPVHLDVSSIISSRELESRLLLEGRFLPNAMAEAYRGLGIEGKFTDKPTISYTPLTGERLINALLRPISPRTVFAMIESGYSPDFILQLTVKAINGVQGPSESLATRGEGDPTFRSVVEAIQRIERAGALGVRSINEDPKAQTFVSFRKGLGADVDRDIERLQQALDLYPDRDEYALAFGARQSGRGEIALFTRSMQQIHGEMATGVEVPDRDLTEGRAVVPLAGTGNAKRAPLLRVRSSADRPENAHVAVFYRNLWFSIDDRDLSSKRSLMFLMMFSALAETGSVPQVPILTVPAR